PFDAPLAHLHFSIDCFKRAWMLWEQVDRSPEEDEEMTAAAVVSLWHWNQRADCTDLHRSVGCWLIARTFSALRRGDEARRYAETSLACAAGAPPFYLGYAHEGVARAAWASNDEVEFYDHLRIARELAAAVVDQDDRMNLEKDLEALTLAAGDTAILKR
ncbi:MAG: hypothetical protein ACRDD1_06450, partial [Planctomycetia bacterium]